MNNAVWLIMDSEPESESLEWICQGKASENSSEILWWELKVDSANLF